MSQFLLRAAQAGAGACLTRGGHRTFGRQWAVQSERMLSQSADNGSRVARRFFSRTNLGVKVVITAVGCTPVAYMVLRWDRKVCEARGFSIGTAIGEEKGRIEESLRAQQREVGWLLDDMRRCAHDSRGLSERRLKKILKEFKLHKNRLEEAYPDVFCNIKSVLERKGGLLWYPAIKVEVIAILFLIGVIDRQEYIGLKYDLGEIKGAHWKKLGDKKQANTPYVSPSSML